MRSHELTPGRLAHLISALYEATSGTHAGALRDAAANSKMQVLVSTQHVPQHMNRYKISAALLAPTWKGMDLSGLSALNSSNRDRSTGTVPPTAAAQSLHQHGWSSRQPGVHAACSAQLSSFSSTSLLAADMMLENSSAPAALSDADSASHCSSHQGRLFSVYLLIAGISGGYDQHVQAARQLYSQADFFVCAKRDSFWHRVAAALDHGWAVPELLQQPLDSFLVPWLKTLYQRCLPTLVHQGYAGLEVVLSGHSLGGFIADSATLMLPYSFQGKQIRFSSVTFDSPGVPAAVIMQYGSAMMSTAESCSGGMQHDRCALAQQVACAFDNSEAAKQSVPISSTEFTVTTPGPAAGAATEEGPDRPVLASAAPMEAATGAASCLGISMVSYLASPTPLNTLFRHPGMVYYVLLGNQQENSTFDVVAYTLIDAARMFFLHDVSHLLLQLYTADPNPAATGSAASDNLSFNLTQPTVTQAVGCVAAAAAASLSLSTTLATDFTTAAIASLSTAAAFAGIFGSLAGRLGLAAVDLVEQHGLDGIRFRAFDPESGDHCAAKVQQMQRWPIFSPGSEIKAVVMDLAMGVLPSFVCRTNRGLWTLWEGKAVRSRRVLLQQQGFVPQKAY